MISFVALPLKEIGGSANLAIDGSVTPVAFEYSPPVDYDVQVEALSFLFESATAFQFGNKFILSTLGNLANGLLLSVKASGQTVATWQNMKRTRDLIEISEDFNLVTGTINFLRVKIRIPTALRLRRNGIYPNPDYLRVTVRDDLSSITFAEAHLQGVTL